MHFQPIAPNLYYITIRFSKKTKESITAISRDVLYNEP